MTRVYVSIGSNIAPWHHVQTVLQELRECYGDLRVSSVYESEAMGFEGDNFYNLVVGFDTASEPHEVVKMLQQLELQHGRQREEKRLVARTLDLDLLLYGRAVIDSLRIPREDIVKYAFVLLPLSEIAPTERHPVRGQTFAQLWEEFDKGELKLWRVAGR